MDFKEMINVLIDLHEECEAEKQEYWDKAIEGMTMLDTEHFEAIRKVASRQGEISMIETVVAMMTSEEDAENIFGAKYGNQL